MLYSERGLVHQDVDLEARVVVVPIRPVVVPVVVTTIAGAIVAPVRR